MAPIDFSHLLRKGGMRATEGRVQLLKVLAEEKKPVTIEELKKKLSGHLDMVNVYRALEALKKAGIVERMDFQHGHAHYELVAGRPHHHHAICRSCGTIEDIEIPHSAKPEKEAERRAKKFSIIDSYSLEFFGLCTSCT
ncbi:MAG: transcriptional repressor [Minisyncoccia bacterium]